MHDMYDIYNIKETLVKFRREAGLSQIEVAKRLTEMGLPTKNKSVSSWEKGLASPNATQFLALCQIYNIEDIYSNFIGFLNHSTLNTSRLNISGLNISGLNISGLNIEGIRKAAEYIELLQESSKYSNSPEKINETINETISASDKTTKLSAKTSKKNNSSEKTNSDNNSDNIITFASPQPRVLPVYDLPASAGTGEFIDNDYHQIIEVSPNVPDNADFGIRIHGDSMNPLFENGDIVWVRRTSELQEGDIGIFYLDGEAYCKKIHFVNNKKESQLQLVSLNPAYKPIDVSANSDFRIYGRVLH